MSSHANFVEQEQRYLNSAILNIHKWLRKRDQTLKHLIGIGGNTLPKFQEGVKKLLEEAKKQEEKVNVLLTRVQKFISYNNSQVLDVNLENLSYLWKSYLVCLRKYFDSQVDIGRKDTSKQNKTAIQVKSGIQVSGTVTNDQDSKTPLLNTCFERPLLFGEEEEGQSQLFSLEQFSVDGTESVSSGSNSSIDSLNDFSDGSFNLDELEKDFRFTTQLLHDKNRYAQEFSLSPEFAQLSKLSIFVEDGGDATADTESQAGGEAKFLSSLKSNVLSNTEIKAEKMSCKGSDQFRAVDDQVVPSYPASPGLSDVSGLSETHARPSLALFETSSMKISEAAGCDVTDGQQTMHLDISSNTSNISSRSESPLSFTHSRSETPTGTLTRAERQNDLWKAIGCIDPFLMDKDIVEACRSANDLTCSDEDYVGAPNVSFAEFLQQYRELTEWLSQVHKVTQREVTSLSEKYLNQSYHEEMLERSPRREFLNNYSHQVLVRYPNMADQISSKMARLNTQWEDVEQAIVPKHGKHDADTMLQDLECDLNSLRRWLNAIEARLLPLTIKADWTDSEFEERLRQHQALQRDIESHNKIVNAVLKLSQRLEHHSPAGGTESSLQQVALNLERRWHGIWLQSLEWQCRLEGAISRRKGVTQSSFDLNIFSLSELDESLFDQSSNDISDQGLIELDDDSLLFIGHRDDFTHSPTGSSVGLFNLTSRRSSLATSESLNDDSLEDLSTDIILEDDLVETRGSGANTPTGSVSPNRPSGFLKPDSSPLGKRPFPGPGSGEASPAKRGSQSPSSSSGGLSPTTQGSPLESFILSRGLHISSKEGLLINSIHSGDEYISLTSSRLLFDRSSGDSANISETESKMGDSPPANNLLEGARNHSGNIVTSSDGEGVARVAIRLSTSDVKDIGYSSESQSNDEIEVMGHQIDMEYRFQGKCELASDGPLGEKITLPSTAVKPHYYSLTIMDVDSTDKTDNGDTTDSGGERMKKMSIVKKNNFHNGFHSGSDRSEKNVETLSLSGSDRQDGSNDEFMFELNGNKELDSLNGMWDSDSFPSSMNGHFDEVDNLEHLYAAEHDNGMLPMHTCIQISESDSAPESRDKKSIRYLIEHAEDLVKPSSPQHSIKPGSPKKHQPTLLQPSPSKQTQTDSCGAVESSCDASGEDNSDHEGAPKPSSALEEFSTATDDADETLFNSVINLESAKNASTDDITRPTPHGSPVLDSARLRKQTGGNTNRRGKKDRPWSVVGLQEFNNSHKLKNDNLQQIIAASESAIDHLHFSTDTDSPQLFHAQFQSSTFPRESRSERFHRSFSTSEQTSTGNSVRRKIKYPGVHNGEMSPKKGERTLVGLPSEETRAGESSSTTKSQFSGNSSGAEWSPTKTRRARRLRRRSSLEKKEAIAVALTRSSTTDSYDSAEAESESETADEYHTAPMEAPTSDGDDVHNVSGSLSEHSAWDNFQIMYPTASEDPGEELLVWEPQDELEFDDDFQLSKHGRSLVSAVMNNGPKRSKLKFTKNGIPGDDSDSDLEDFHHILDQSELQLRLADQSLRKRRKDPMGTGLHPNPAKYDEIIVTYETNIGCLNNVCHHLKSDEITEKDCQRVKDIMYQWNKLYSLALERHTQTTSLGHIRERFADMKVNIQQAESCLPFDRFSSAQELKETIKILQKKKQVLEIQGQQLVEIQKSLTEFSALHPIICVDKYLQELVSLQKSTSSVTNKVTEHVNVLENNREVWLEYLDSQQELDRFLAADRERLQALLCQREFGMKVTKKDVLRELEQLQTNLSMYESKLLVLQTMRTRLTKTSDHNSQRLLLAACADLRNQLLVVTERCQQIYRDVEEDDDLPVGHETDLGRLAISAASLHEAFKNRQGQHPQRQLDDDSISSPTNSCVSRTCASWLRSLPVHLVALMLLAGLAYALDPDILDHLANFTLTVEPELHYVNGPPSI
ncbi:unnamed protein product [Lymnaea stagnalis]|uniref:KASH domain-containing protein n=1 Tax=Lymnaea stagnalis TaxID=6523 RepID=A0AAV2H427_LYMST